MLLHLEVITISFLAASPVSRKPVSFDLLKGLLKVVLRPSKPATDVADICCYHISSILTTAVTRQTL